MDRVFSSVDADVLPEELVLGVPVIDREHEAWIRLVRSFQDALANGHASESLYASLADALIYTERHFSNEEQLMLEVGYPLLADHKAQHALAAAELHKFTTGDHDEAEMIAYVANFFPNWLLCHINSADRKLAEWLRQHRGAGASTD